MRLCYHLVSSTTEINQSFPLLLWDSMMSFGFAQIRVLECTTGQPQLVNVFWPSLIFIRHTFNNVECLNDLQWIFHDSVC